MGTEKDEGTENNYVLEDDDDDDDKGSVLLLQEGDVRLLQLGADYVCVASAPFSPCVSL